jgi:hypothetical protein
VKPNPSPSGRPEGRPDHLDAFRGEHLVKAGSELRVAIPDQEPERPSVLGEISCEVAGDLGDKRAGRMIANPPVSWLSRIW